ncbi:hypothetical protein SAMN02583745_02933, partial [Thorsellia anophelis DSM 18579]
MESQFTTFTQSIKAVFNPSHILKLSRKVKFTQKLRTLHPANLIGALIHALSCQDHANLTDILRVLNERYQELLNYKPYHNQIKKPEFTNLLQSLTEQATKELLIQPFQSSLPPEYPFKHIHLHDGSSLTLHEKLKDVYQGRFTKTAPAAIEMHLTLDLVA